MNQLDFILNDAISTERIGDSVIALTKDGKYTITEDGVYFPDDDFMEGEIDIEALLDHLEDATPEVEDDLGVQSVATLIEDIALKVKDDAGRDVVVGINVAKLANLELKTYVSVGYGIIALGDAIEWAKKEFLVNVFHRFNVIDAKVEAKKATDDELDEHAELKYLLDASNRSLRTIEGWARTIARFPQERRQWALSWSHYDECARIVERNMESLFELGLYEWGEKGVQKRRADVLTLAQKYGWKSSSGDTNTVRNEVSDPTVFLDDDGNMATIEWPAPQVLDEDGNLIQSLNDDEENTDDANENGSGDVQLENTTSDTDAPLKSKLGRVLIEEEFEQDDAEIVTEAISEILKNLEVGKYKLLIVQE